MTTLSRTRPAPAVRALHLGLGNFFRAHQAWYTQHAGDAEQWGIAAFTGLSGPVAEILSGQDGLYHLDVRSPQGDEYEVIESLVAIHDANDVQAWIRYWRDPAVQYVTLTVTEAGYRRNATGGLNTEDPEVAADLEILDSGRTDVSTAPARLVSGLLARRAARAGAFTIIPCDNLPGNAAALSQVVHELAAAVDPTLVGWMDDNVTFVSTAVDRITPATTDTDRARILQETGVPDAMPVATEPFKEWVLAGTFAGERPKWETAGAIITDDATPYEKRKLTLLNGSHSLLAYAGPLRGHATVAQAISDPVCREWVNQWWDEAGVHLPMDTTTLDHYRQALLERFANPNIEHKLAQIAMDGSLKLTVRVLPTVRAERAAGRVPTGALRILAAWVASFRQPGEHPGDPQLATLVEFGQLPLDESVPALLGVLDADLPADSDLVQAVTRIVCDLQAG